LCIGGELAMMNYVVDVRVMSRICWQAQFPTVKRLVFTTFETLVNPNAPISIDVDHTFIE